jgi:replication factor A1
VHEIQVHTFKADIVGAPTLIEDVSSSTKRPLEPTNTPPKITPIASLHSSLKVWTLKVRVLSKTDLRTFTNAKGLGHVFSFDVIDAKNGEIHITCFNIQATNFHPSIHIGKVYVISKGYIKLANKEFNHLKNDWEITLDITSTIEACLEDDHSIENHNFVFTPINMVPTLVNNCIVDIIGVVISISPLATIMRKNGTKTHKRTLQLKDMSGYSIEVTLWGVLCSKHNIDQYSISNTFPIIALKAGKVTSFNRISITTTFTSQLSINPILKEAQDLRTWFDNPLTDTSFHSLSAHGASGGHPSIQKHLVDIENEGIGKGPNPTFILVEETIASLNADNCWYVACPLTFKDRKCKKKTHTY